MGLNFKTLQMSPMTVYAESAADQTDHFVDAFVCKNVAHGPDVVQLCDIRNNTVDAILFREIQC